MLPIRSNWRWANHPSKSQVCSPCFTPLDSRHCSLSCCSPSISSFLFSKVLNWVSFYLFFKLVCRHLCKFDMLKIEIRNWWLLPIFWGFFACFLSKLKWNQAFVYVSDRSAWKLVRNSWTRYFSVNTSILDQSMMLIRE